MHKKKAIIPAICLILGAALGILPSILAGASNRTEKQLNAIYQNIAVVIDGAVLDPRDVAGTRVEPFSVDGTVYVPVRALGEALGMEVTWHGDTSIVALSRPRSGGGWGVTADVAVQPPPAPSKNVTVSNVSELFAAIASDTCITLQAGVYDVSDVYDEAGAKVPVSTLTIAYIQGLVLQAEDGAMVELITPDRNSEVISISDCNGVTLRGVKAGHSVTGEYMCDAGVLSVASSANILVDDCYLYGCGSIGIHVRDCVAVDVKNTTVTDCSLYGVYLQNCAGITFADCKLIDNRAYGNVIAGYNIAATFTGCEISGNRHLEWGVVDIDGEDILFDGCVFRNNALAAGHYAPVIAGRGIKLQNCVIEKAGFNLGYGKDIIDLGGNIRS